MRIPSPEAVFGLFHEILTSPELEGEVELEGARYRVAREPEPGVRLRAEPLPPADEAAVELTVLDAAPERPTSYPGELPFIPGAGTVLASARGGMLRFLCWDVEKTAEELKGALRRALADGGWRRSDGTIPGAFGELFRRGDRACVVFPGGMTSDRSPVLMELAWPATPGGSRGPR
jgi:hypothetical protein